MALTTATRAGSQTARFGEGVRGRHGTGGSLLVKEAPRTPGDSHSPRTVRYPITQSRPGCYGDRSSLPGVRSYGKRDPQELYDVYCFARELGGKARRVWDPVATCP